MAYGTIKVDTITFTDAGVDKSVTISGLVQNPTFSGNITVTGTVSGNTIQGQTVSGATITGGAAAFTTVTGGVATITSGVFALGSASNPSISFTGDANSGLYSPGADQVAISTGGSGRLFVDASGRVGVGTPNPGSVLHLTHPTAADIRLTVSSTLQGTLYSSSSDTNLFSVANNPLIFGTNNSERLRITSAGLVGIGTSAPGALLHVGGNTDDNVQAILAQGNDSNFRLVSINKSAANISGSEVARFGIRYATGTSDSSGIQFFRGNTAAEGHLGLYTGGTTRLYVQGTTGNVGIGSTAPGEALTVEGKIWVGNTSTEPASTSDRGDITITNDTGPADILFLDRGLAATRIGVDTGDSGNFKFVTDKEFVWRTGGTSYSAFNTGTERARIDSSGRLLVGTSSAYAVQGFNRSHYFAPLSGENNNQIVVSSVTTGTPAVFFTRTRGATPTTYTVVQNGDNLGILEFFGADGTNYSASGARITAQVDGTPGANDMPGRLVFSTTADGASSPTERMRISNAGTTTLTSAASTAPFIANISASEVARIDSSGRLLVGTSTSVAALVNAGLQVHGTAGSSWIASARWSNDIDNPGYVFAKSRGASVGTRGVLANGDFMGVIYFTGDDGTNFINSASIAAVVDGTPGTNDMPGRLVFSTTADGASSPTERLRITSAGLVGIGTSTAESTLHVNGNITVGYPTQNQSSTNLIQVRSQSDPADKDKAAINLGTTAGATSSSSFIEFFTNNYGVDRAARMRIDPQGRVGIGTSSPSDVLHVVGGGRFTGSAVSLDVSGAFIDYSSNIARIAGCHSSGGTITFLTNPNAGFNTERARIDSSGRLLVGTSSNRTGAAFQIEGTTFGTSLGTITNNSANSAPAYFQLIKSRGTSVGSQALVANGDGLGNVQFIGADGTQQLVAAAIEGIVDGTPGTNDMPGRLVFSTTADGASSPTERMRIANNGAITVSNAADNIFASSNVSPGTSNFFFLGFTSGSSRVVIWNNGNVVNTNNSYGAISDVKLKENIVDANSQWDDLKALQVRNYNFKEGQTHTQIGLVAQEAELVSPGLVSESPDRDAEGNDLGTVTKSVNYSVLYMKAVKALQEAMERIEVLEQRLTDAGIA